MNAIELIDFIDDWAKEASYDETHDLWSVLTALRGPDNPYSSLKARTTEVLRRGSLPILSARAGAFVAVQGRAFEYEPSEDHFLGHVNQAARVLERAGRLTIVGEKEEE